MSSIHGFRSLAKLRFLRKVILFFIFFFNSLLSLSSCRMKVAKNCAVSTTKMCNIGIVWCWQCEREKENKINNKKRGKKHFNEFLSSQFSRFRVCSRFHLISKKKMIYKEKNNPKCKLCIVGIAVFTDIFYHRTARKIHFQTSMLLEVPWVVNWNFVTTTTALNSSCIEIVIYFQFLICVHLIV